MPADLTVGEMEDLVAKQKQYLGGLLRDVIQDDIANQRIAVDQKPIIDNPFRGFKNIPAPPKRSRPRKDDEELVITDDVEPVYQSETNFYMEWDGGTNINIRCPPDLAAKVHAINSIFTKTHAKTDTLLARLTDEQSKDIN